MAQSWSFLVTRQVHPIAMFGIGTIHSEIHIEMLLHECFTLRSDSLTAAICWPWPLAQHPHLVAGPSWHSQ